MHPDWLNYHHLLYFWLVAKEGSVTRASEVLHLAQPTISGQLKKLEDSLGEKLFDRVGRELVLTEVGQLVYRHADEIFSIGQELALSLKGRPTGRPVKLKVGVPEVLPKMIAFRLLEPALRLDDKIQIDCREGPMEQLLTQLATHELDVVFSDSPAGSMVRVRAFNHALGECGVGIYGISKLCRKYDRSDTAALNGAPFLLPAYHTALRRSLDGWFVDQNIQPDVIAEIDDTALMKVFAEAGLGFVPGPMAIRAEIEKQFGLSLFLELPNAVERFYAITVERRIRHPAIIAICETAKESLFGSSS